MPPKKLKAVHIDPEDGSETQLGECEYSDQGRLTLVSAEEEFRQFLQNFIDTANRGAELVVKSSPEEGEERYGLSARIYKRSSPDFSRGLRNYALCYHSVALTSPEDEAAALQKFEELS